MERERETGQQTSKQGVFDLLTCFYSFHQKIKHLKNSTSSQTKMSNQTTEFAVGVLLGYVYT